MVSDRGLRCKRGTVQGEILAVSRHIKLFCGVQSPFQSWESTPRDSIVVKIFTVLLSYSFFFFLSINIFFFKTSPAVKLPFCLMCGREKAQTAICMNNHLFLRLIAENKRAVFIPHSNLWHQAEKQPQINRWKNRKQATARARWVEREDLQLRTDGSIMTYRAHYTVKHVSCDVAFLSLSIQTAFC